MAMNVALPVFATDAIDFSQTKTHHKQILYCSKLFLVDYAITMSMFFYMSCTTKENLYFVVVKISFP
jgi:hypothetical protein